MGLKELDGIVRAFMKFQGVDSGAGQRPLHDMSPGKSYTRDNAQVVPTGGRKGLLVYPEDYGFLLA